MKNSLGKLQCCALWNGRRENGGRGTTEVVWYSTSLFQTRPEAGVKREETALSVALSNSLPCPTSSRCLLLFPVFPRWEPGFEWGFVTDVYVCQILQVHWKGKKLVTTGPTHGRHSVILVKQMDTWKRTGLRPGKPRCKVHFSLSLSVCS